MDNETNELRARVAALEAALRATLPYVYTGTNDGSERIRNEARDALSGGTQALDAVVAAAVEFDADGTAGGGDRDWQANTDGKFVHLSIALRPGEDAGVTTATILAACGRGP